MARSTTHDQRCHQWSRCPKNSVFRRARRPSSTVTTTLATATSALSIDTTAPVTPTSMAAASRTRTGHASNVTGPVEGAPCLQAVEERR